MLHQSLFVFDIETVPDTSAVYNLTGSTEKDPEKLREELTQYHLDITDGRNSFPRQPFHKVVAVSFLEAEIVRNDDGTESYHLKTVASNQKDEEKYIVKGFFDYLQRIKPRLVSYNGRSFDMPVMKYRGMAHGVNAKWFYGAGDKWNSYMQRYSPDWHCDLLEVLSDFGASARVKLNEACSIMGYPGKFGVDGSKVTEMYENGEIDAIKHYCETDVLNTYLVYLRTMQHQGKMTTVSYNKAIADVVSFIENESAEKPYLAEFMDAWGDACNNKFMLDEDFD